MGQRGAGYYPRSQSLKWSVTWDRYGVNASNTSCGCAITSLVPVAVICRSWQSPQSASIVFQKQKPIEASRSECQLIATGADQRESRLSHHFNRSETLIITQIQFDRLRR